MTPIAEGDSLLQFIPQRTPMVMIDKLFLADADKCITGLLITSANIFCSNGVFREPGLIENMAQTAAVRAGHYYCSQAKEGDYKGAPIGFIGAIKDLIIHFLPPVNAELITEIKIMHQIFDATVINAFVTVNGERAAECEMKIFIKKN